MLFNLNLLFHKAIDIYPWGIPLNEFIYLVFTRRPGELPQPIRVFAVFV